MAKYIGAIDQGTTSTRFILFVSVAAPARRCLVDTCETEGRLQKYSRCLLTE